MAAADKKAAASAEKLVDLVALQPVKYGGKRVGPGGDLLGVPQGVAVAMLTKGLAAVGAEAQAKAEAEAKAKAEAEVKAKAEAEAKAGGQAALLPEGNKQ